MKRNILILFSVLAYIPAVAQSIQQRIDKAMQLLLKDEQMKHASVSLNVVETATGKTVYAFNEQTGLAAASTQKIFTSIASFDVLGKDYRFKTAVSYDGSIQANVLNGNIYITGYGDPTLGSDRFNNGNAFIDQLVAALRAKGISSINGSIYADASKFENNPVPDGWIWQDIGNYYGAGCWAINWNENAYGVQLKSGKNIGDTVEVTAFFPPQEMMSYNNELTSAAAGSGDNAYVYTSPYSQVAMINGTIPVNERKFNIRGAVTDGPAYLLKSIAIGLDKNGIKHTGDFKTSFDALLYEKPLSYKATNLFTYYSPTLDSVTYWFLQKSINLYGEALMKTMAYEQTGLGSTQNGLKILNDFWSSKGIDPYSLNIMDGSGLSPQNRVTTNALVTALQYAKGQPWYNSFYNALPTYNGMKMKSGTIGGERGFTGYHTAKSGSTYTFAIIINNYDDSKGSITSKMFMLLDELK